MHGINLNLIVLIPPYYKAQGNVSLVSGLLNSCTYVGSSLSTYGIAVIFERIGWDFTLLTWLGITLAGTAVCLLFSKPWKHFVETQS